jgi:hypothetical protein
MVQWHLARTVLTTPVQVRTTAAQLADQRLVLLLHLLRRAQEEP